MYRNNCTLFYQIEGITRHISRGRVFVGVKKLLGLIDSVRVMKDATPQKRIAAFVNLLEDEGVFTAML